MTEKQAITHLVGTLCVVKQVLNQVTKHHPIEPATVSELKFLLSMIDKSKLLTLATAWEDWNSCRED